MKTRTSHPFALRLGDGALAGQVALVAEDDDGDGLVSVRVDLLKMGTKS